MRAGIASTLLVAFGGASIGMVTDDRQPAWCSVLTQLMALLGIESLVAGALLAIVDRGRPWRRLEGSGRTAFLALACTLAALGVVTVVLFAVGTVADGSSP